MKVILGNVTSPKGFKAYGDFVGLKKAKKDMALIVSDEMCVASGCFTTNVVKAAPVLWDMKTVSNPVKAIVINSGNANACTGQQGLKDAEETAEYMAKLEKVSKDNVLVSSTGVIGVNLQMDKIKKGIDTLYPNLGYTYECGESAAEAIMTTDTVKKQVAVTIDLDGKTVTLGGICKGSGMINPNMATMLCFITTDCNISKALLDNALKDCVTDTFNMISVDGDTSTNDTVLVLANKLSGNKEITTKDKNYIKFKKALMYITKNLAIMCADDGEGASKLMEVTVTGAKGKNNARKIANSVVSSNLFKAALFGEDANWGRVLCAMGYSGGSFNPDKVTIIFRSNYGEITLMDMGKPIVFDEELAKNILKEHKIYIDILLTEGKNKATAWGCDLTYDYVKINGDYRS